MRIFVITILVATVAVFGCSPLLVSGYVVATQLSELEPSVVDGGVSDMSFLEAR